jgi:hypothetical protein
MQFIMPFVSILFWAGVVGFFWFWWSPRSFGRFVGGKFLKATSNEPRKIAGAQILGLFVVGIVLTIVFWNIYPLSVFPIWFAWFKLFQKMTKISKKVSSGSDTQSA